MYSIKTYLIIILALIILNIFSTNIAESSNNVYLKTLKIGEQIEYLKRVHVTKYSGISEETEYSRILRGECLEEAKYIVISISNHGFAIEKKVLRSRNMSSSKIVCDYLKIIDQSFDYSLNSSEIYFRDIQYFPWDYEFKKPSFQLIEYNDIPIPWIFNVYIYIPSKYASIIRKYESTIASTRIVDDKVVNFYYSIDLVYDRDKGLLNKLDCIITINLNKKPYILINIVIEKKQSNLLELIYSTIIWIILNTWKYIVAIVSIMVFYIFIYRRL